MLAACVGAFVLATTVAFAQSSSITAVFISPGARVVSETDIGGSARGQVVVSFHGDAASGCRALGVCGYSGTVFLRPPSSIDLLILKLRIRRKISYSASIGLGDESGDQTTTARVDRSSGGRVVGSCADSQAGDSLPSIDEHGRLATVQLFDSYGSVLATRCAGPRDRILAASGPKLTLPVGRLIRGEQVIDLHGTRSFAAHGFAGTITSSLAVRLGKPRKLSELSGGGGEPPPGTKTVRMRSVTQRVSLVRLQGSVTASFTGSPNLDVCAVLDSCGATGATMLHPIPRAPYAALSASGPARLPYRAFLVALGLRRGSPSRTIRVAGTVSWEERGTSHERLSEPDRCSDARPLEGGFVEIQPLRARLFVSYGPIGPLATQCAGPDVGSQQFQMLSGAMPRATLAAHTFTLRLNRGSWLHDDGYNGSVRGSLRLTLRRGRITQHVFTEPQ